MMKNILLPLIIASTASSMALADHNRGFFVGGAISYVSNDDLATNTTDDEVNVPTIEISGGYKYNSWLGIDIRVGAGLRETDVDPDADTAAASPTLDHYEFKITGFQSIYYRPEITNKEAKLYGLIGYSTVDVETTGVDSAGNTIFEGEESESGPSYGIGAGWFVNDSVNINLEYKALLDEDDAEFDSVSLGMDYRF